MDENKADVAENAVQKLGGMGAELPSELTHKLSETFKGSEHWIKRSPRNRISTASSGVHIVLPADHHLIEGVVYDEKRNQLYATSVVGRTLLKLGMADAQVVPAREGLGSLLAGTYDLSRDRIWLVAAAVEQTPKEGGRFVGLIEFDPATQTIVRKVPLPIEGETGPNDIALAEDGTLYVSDMVTGAIYRCPASCTSLQTFVPPRTLRSAHGLVVSSDQKWIYVADFRYGLAAIERSTGKVTRVNAPDDTMLDGIDGLVRHGQDLVAVQNGTSPKRIIRLRLSEDGMSVRNLTPLEHANPAWGEPTLAALAGNHLLYVADAQWEAYGPGGAVAGKQAPRPTPIRSLSLD